MRIDMSRFRQRMGREMVANLQRGRQLQIARRQARQRGSISVLSAVTLIVMLGLCGMALELSQVYNRKIELAGLARSVALAAARELNGGPNGVDNAIMQAQKLVASAHSGYGHKSLPWSDALVTFGNSPTTSSWMGATEAKAAQTVTSTYFVKVDTSALGDDPGTVTTVLMPVLSTSLSKVKVSEVIVAGRGSIKVLPLAICAMSTTPGAKRTNTVTTGGTTTTLDELVEYGFRRGISYDLMQLNPGGTTAENFVIDPYIGPGVTSASVNTTATAVSPFICTGKMWMPTVAGGKIRVARPFPIASLFQQLNSRFDVYDNTAASAMRCSPEGAPPDANIKAFKAGSGISWMNPVQTQQSPSSAVTAAAGASPGRLENNADLPSMPSGQTAAMYGPIWSYAKAVPFSQYSASTGEPANGYTPFGTTAWATLYKPNSATSAAAVVGYPGSSPYLSTSVATSQAPSGTHSLLAQRYRRVLNVPLLSCPVASGSSGTATVLAVAKFFMTIPATSASLNAEFAGIASQQNIVGDVEIYE